MKTLDFTISIPVSTKANAQMILDEIAQAIEERLEECHGSDDSGCTTVADVLGCGGNTITVSHETLIYEICL